MHDPVPRRHLILVAGARVRVPGHHSSDDGMMPGAGMAANDPDFSVMTHHRPRIITARQNLHHLTYVDAPGSASWISDIMWHAVRVRSYVRPLDAAFIRRGPVWCSWIGSKSLPRARSPASGAGFSDPVFNDLLPLCCLSSSPHQPGSSADQAVRAVPAAPGIPFREVEPLLSRQLSFPGSHAAAAIAAGAR